MRSTPIISIGLPVYNGEKFIREAIDALLSQTESNFELIVSDNASTDATEQICREYAFSDRRVIYIRHDENQEAMHNFAFVLGRARARYFMWAGHDDKWSENWLAKLLSAHQDGVVLTFGEVVAVDIKGEVIRHCRNLAFTGSLLFRSIRFAFQDEFEGKANLIYGLFRTDVLRDVLRTECIGNRFAMDALIIFSVLQRGAIATMAGAYLYKRAGGHGDKDVQSYSLVKRLTALYLLPYYFGYIQRAHRFATKVILTICLPLLVGQAQSKRFARAIARRLQ